MDLLGMKDLSMDELDIIADMRSVKAEKTMKKDELFKNLKKYDKITYNELQFKPIVLDIRSILPKKKCNKIKNSLKYVEKRKKLTYLQIENVKNNLIKIRDDLVEKFKKNDRIKIADRDYYECENNGFYGSKDIRNLFDQNDDDIYEGIEYLFDESMIVYGMKQNGLEYEEIRKLISIQPKEVRILLEIKQNGLEYKEIRKLLLIQLRKENCRHDIHIHEEIEDKNVEFCKIIEDQMVEFCEVIIDQKVVFCEEIELIEHQKV